MSTKSKCTRRSGMVHACMAIPCLMGLLAIGLTAPPVLGQITERQKLIASDPDVNHSFGHSVSIDGDTMVVGAPNNDDCGAGPQCGAAYVYQFNGVIWIQQAKLTASDAASPDTFGVSVSISGDTIVVGAYFDNCAAGFSCGSAYVFVKPGGGWSDMTQTAKLTASDAAAFDNFGVSVSISGDTIVAGAASDDCAAGSSCGSAYVFDKPGGGWTNLTQTAKLTASDADVNDRFGQSVSINGDTIVVGAIQDGCGAGSECGSAYVFVRPGGGWSDITETAKLTASDQVALHHFGVSVSLTGDTIVVGAIGGGGGAYVFVNPGGGWANMTQTAKLTGSDGGIYSVSIIGDTVVAGAPNACAAGSLCGAADVFIKPGGGWSNMTETAKLTASDAADSDYFGYSVSLSGNTFVVGAYGDDCGPGPPDCGAAYVFGPFRLYVDANATGLNNGTSWINAYTRLQDALSYASIHSDVIEIWVADGAYKPTDQSCNADSNCGGGSPNICSGPGGACIWDQPREQTFQLLNGVAIYGGFAGGETSLCQRDPSVNVTILSGDLNGNDGPGLYEDYAENSYHVVTGSGVTATAVLDGFTVYGGNANGPAVPHQLGGGMTILNGSPTVRNCIFESNVAQHYGGAMANDGGSPVLRTCTFTLNVAQAVAASYGGAIYNTNGGALVVAHALFSQNGSDAYGGAIHTEAFATTTVVRAYFAGNGSRLGGAVSNVSGWTSLYNCDFWLNAATQNGGAIHRGGTGMTTLRNCTLGENSATISGGGIHFDGGTVDVKNSILWDNSDSGGMDSSAQFHGDGGTACLNHSIIQGGWSGCGGTGVLDDDPLYFDPATYNHFLLHNSPAVDAGDNTAVPPDTYDLDNDGNTVERLPLDAYGRGRFTDNPLVSNTGVQDLPDYPQVVDMGAYETPLILYWYVDADATGGNNGSSWAHAFTKLQDASAATGTAPNEEIWVAEGTYYPDEGEGVVLDDRAATFQLLSGVELYGGFAGFEYDLSQRNIEANPTILSGDLTANDGPAPFQNNAENSYHVVSGNNTTATAVLDGFTITAGNANSLALSRFRGGAMINELAANPTVRNCLFKGNYGLNGGSVYNNVAAPSFTGCVFFANAGDNGGAMQNVGGTTARITNCSFMRNSATVAGGGVSNRNSAPSFVNCVFSSNTSSAPGGGMANDVSASPSIINCTFTSNEAVTNGGGIYDGDSGVNSPAITSCVLWSNVDAGGSDESAQIHTVSGTPMVNYSIVQGGWSGAGSDNLNADPLFIDADGADNVVGTEDDNLRLLPGSPAIDAADTTALPTDTADLDGDANTNEVIPFDLAGNPRILDDPATPDMGGPGSPDVDMGAYEFFGDCNGNGIPDQCDLSCGSAAGPCDVPGCGGSSDCDPGKGKNNGIPDECDIAGCFGDPACDDCNLNGVPDACDIAVMTSDDLDFDGVPDECIDFNGGCPAMSNDWSCFDNWDLPGEVYPDNSGPVTYSVTLDQTDNVVLDVDVTIDSLAIIDNSVLNVTQTGAAGDLAIVASGGLLIEGTLRVANDRAITVPNGPVVLQSGGLYAKHPAAAAGSVSAALSSQRVDILQGGELRLEDSMSLSVTGDLRLACLTECDGLRGGQTPPILQSTTGQAYIQGNAVLNGTVTWGYSSSAPLELAGSFVNHCTSPQGFDFVHGTMLLNGTTEQRFEVAGDDLGAARTGFLHPVGMHSNFAMGTLDVAAGSGREVIFENEFANIVGAGPCDEALYVHHLILRSGSHITLNNCKIYYETLTNEGATITTSGCGQLSAIPACTQDGECADSSACYHDECAAGACQLTRVEYGDVDGGGGATPIDLNDILCVLDGFANQAVCPNGDIVPCVPSGGIDLDDILAVLDAFAGADPCNCPAP